MPKLHSLSALLVIGLCASFPVLIQAEEAWSVQSGRTQLLLDLYGLDDVGIQASVHGPSAEGDIVSVVDLQTSESNFVILTDGGVPSEYGGTIAHGTSIVLSSGTTSVRLDGLALQLGGSDDQSWLSAGFNSDDAKAVALIGREFKVGFDRAGRQLLAEVAYLEMSQELAARLGRPDLAGFSIGGLRLEADLDWVGGELPRGDEMNGGVAGGNMGTDCWNPGEPMVGPDVIVGVLSDIAAYGSVGGITAFSVGTISCNVGSSNLNWIANNNQHPVIGQSMYRLREGRFEHLGQSWLKHGFLALTNNDCGCGCSGQGGAVLGVGCSDPYGAGLNGSQPGLGPKSQVNPNTGFFTYPHDSSSGNAIYKRVQVRISDLDPAQNGGGLYFVEGQYVAPDDAAAGNQDNNASYRRVNVTGAGADWTATMNGPTIREKPAIRAWRDNDPTVTETDVRVPGEGLFILAAKATELDNGLWHYEYALQNLNSDRAGGWFSVPVPNSAIIENIGFHDVDYHSGEPYAAAEWTAVYSGGQIKWTTDAHDANPNANALRWGTLYNFRFDSNLSPAEGEVAIGLFKPGATNMVPALTVIPDPTGGDCNLNFIPDFCDTTCSGDCNVPGCGLSADCNFNGAPDECEVNNDCNANFTPDDCDIAAGTSVDCDTNENPDECDPDLDGDDQIDGCDEDIDGDGLVNGADACDFSVPGLPIQPSGTMIGDRDADCDVDLIDYNRLDDCLDGPTVPMPSPSCVLLFDSDHDTYVDMLDIANFQNAFTGTGQ